MSDNKIPPIPSFKPHSKAFEEGITGEHILRTAGIEFVASKPMPEGKFMLDDNDVDLYYPEATRNWEERKAEANAYMWDLHKKGYFVVLDEEANPVCYPTGTCGRCVACIVKQSLWMSGALGPMKVERRVRKEPIMMRNPMFNKVMSGGLRRGEYFNYAAFTSRTPYDSPRSNVLADALANMRDRSRIGLISLEQPSFFSHLYNKYLYRPQFTVYDTEVNADGIVRHFAKQFNHPGLVMSGQSLAKQVKDTPYLTIRDDGYFVGGKKVLNSVLGTIWFNLRGADKERFIKYHRFENQWFESPKLLSNQPREPWAEEAIDSMLYQRMYGKLPEVWIPSKHTWGVLNPNSVLRASMVHHEKMRARKRLQDANQPDSGRKKRGH